MCAYSSFDWKNFSRLTSKILHCRIQILTQCKLITLSYSLFDYFRTNTLQIQIIPRTLLNCAFNLPDELFFSRYYQSQVSSLHNILKNWGFDYIIKSPRIKSDGKKTTKRLHLRENLNCLLLRRNCFLSALLPVVHSRISCTFQSLV